MQTPKKSILNIKIVHHIAGAIFIREKGEIRAVNSLGCIIHVAALIFTWNHIHQNLPW